MQRLRVQVVRNILGTKTYTTVPKQEPVVSATFKVQDPKDFNERVKNSKVPVIVDFFATYAFNILIIKILHILI